MRTIKRMNFFGLVLQSSDSEPSITLFLAESKPDAGEAAAQLDLDWSLQGGDKIVVVSIPPDIHIWSQSHNLPMLMPSEATDSDKGKCPTLDQ